MKRQYLCIATLLVLQATVFFKSPADKYVGLAQKVAVQDILDLMVYYNLGWICSFQHQVPDHTFEQFYLYVYNLKDSQIVSKGRVLHDILVWHYPHYTDDMRVKRFLEDLSKIK